MAAGKTYPAAYYGKVPIHVHLGPGVFPTKGYSVGITGGWQPVSGMRITGSGIIATTLKLVNGSVNEQGYCAVAAHYYACIEHFSISDMTIDCNVSNQLEQFVACQAVNVGGTHLRFQRLRIINFGSQTKNYIECFALSSGAITPWVGNMLGGTKAVDIVIEDCIAEWPGPNPVNNSTIFNVGGGEQGSDGVHGYHHGCAIRNCYVNNEIVYGPKTPVDSVTVDGDVIEDTLWLHPFQGYDVNEWDATVTTRIPHGHSDSGNAVLRGVSVGGRYQNPVNGVFAISEVVSPTVLRCKIFDEDPAGGGSGGTLGGGIPNRGVFVEKIIPVDGTTRSFIIKTIDPHNRTTRNNVRVGGVKANSSPDTPYSGHFNGSFQVEGYTPFEIRYTLNVAVGIKLDIADIRNAYFETAIVNVGDIAISADGGTAAVVEGNRIFHVSTGGPWHDTWTTKDVTGRFNYYYDILGGPRQNLAGVSTYPFPILLSSLTYDAVNHKAIAKTNGPHGLLANETVFISGATGADAKYYNGEKPITVVPASNLFEYAIAQDPGPSGPPQGNMGYSTADLYYGAQRLLESLTYAVKDGKYIASAKTTFPKHGFEIGEAVAITKSGHLDTQGFPNSTKFQGAVKVIGVPDDKAFNYELLEQVDPEVDSDYQDLAVFGVKGIQFCLAGEVGIDNYSEDFACGYFGRIWQVRNLVMENNVIGMGYVQLNRYYGEASAIYMSGTYRYAPEHTLLQLVLRGNVIHNVSGRSNYSTRTMELGGTKRALIEHNLIGMDMERLISNRSYSIQYNADCETVRTFNNLQMNGMLVNAYNTADWQPARETTTEIRNSLEEVFLMSML